MLLHQSLDLQECRQQVPFVLGGVNRVRKRFVVVEGFEESIERISMAVGRMRLILLRFLLIFGLVILFGGRRGLFGRGWLFGLRGAPLL